MAGRLGLRINRDIRVIDAEQMVSEIVMFSSFIFQFGPKLNFQEIFLEIFWYYSISTVYGTGYSWYKTHAVTLILFILHLHTLILARILRH